MPFRREFGVAASESVLIWGRPMNDQQRHVDRAGDKALGLLGTALLTAAETQPVEAATDAHNRPSDREAARARMAFRIPAVLRDRNFLIYSLGNTISWLGTWAQRIGVGWLSWALTHQVFWVGLISLLQTLPLIALGPLFGALLDRHDHRYYAMAVNTALALLAVTLYVLTAVHLMQIG